jgi:hypothetical protein
MTSFIYVVAPDVNSKWNQIKILFNKQEAYATSFIYPTYRIELFVISANGYEPTNDYIQNGKYIISDNEIKRNVESIKTFMANKHLSRL